MKLTIESEFPCDANRLFSQVLKSESLHFVAKPLVYFKAIDTLPEVWENGRYLVKMYLFNLIYLGKQWINIRVNAQNQELLDAGSGQLIRKWHHLIQVRPSNNKTTYYTDTIDIQAGVFTPLIVAFAYVFYHHRQKKWRKIIDSDFELFLKK